MKLILALTAALLPALTFAADETDPVRLSFERDLVREPTTQVVGPALAQEDALADAIQAALYEAGAGEIHAAASLRPCAAGRSARKGS